MFLSKFHQFAFRVLLMSAALPIVSGGCAHQFYCCSDATLLSIHIIDRNGLTETISNPDRLKEYACIDFLKNQPYKKVLRVFSRDPCGNTPSIVTSYYENGQVQKYLEVVNNRASGIYYEWYENGALHLQANIIGGVADITMTAENSWLFDGPAQVWNESGNLLAYINYSKGKLEGESCYYHMSGSLWKKFTFCDGKEEGVFEIFYKDGSPLQVTMYTNGQRQGQSTRYWNCGTIAAVEDYNCSKLWQGKYYDKYGNCISEITCGSGQRAAFSENCLKELHTYVNGVPDGEVRMLDVDGTLLRTWVIRDGEKHGTEIEYYPSLGTCAKALPKMEIAWYKGKVHGVVKSWYSNGTQESQREMSNNIKNGLLTAWYRDGTLMLIEEYEEDKLVTGEYYRRGEKTALSEVEDGNGLAVLYDGDGNFIRKVIYRHGRPYEP